jgi:hypothetical protein
MNTKSLSTKVLSGLILVSVVFLAACSPLTGVTAVLVQPNSIEPTNIKADKYLSWEIGADDITAAREAAHYLAAVQRTSHEISTADIAAAREVAIALSQVNPTAVMDVDATEWVSGELDTNDIAAAREAAHYLAAAALVAGEMDAVDIASARQAVHYLEAAVLVSGELDNSDIAAARQAAQTLIGNTVAVGVDLENLAFQRLSAD